MGNIMKEIMVFREYLTCDRDKCGTVMGPGKQSNIAPGAANMQGGQFIHTCPECGDIQSFPHHFPRIVYKELPTIFQEEDAIDEVLGKIEVSMEELDNEHKE